MATKLIKITAKELIRKYHAGERDFSRIKLPKGEVFEYEFPADENCANLGIVILNRVNFSNACIEQVDLRETSLADSIFKDVSLRGSNLDGVSVYRVDFERTNLSYADIRRIQGLDRSLNLEHAVFNFTKVTPKEKEFLREITKGYRHPFELSYK